jgi:hypothetical protein
MNTGDAEWALFDPCSSRGFPGMQNGVRAICDSAGIKIHELPESKERALCCGMGGHIFAANPALSEKMAEAAAAQSPLPYITYCSNCRNLFLNAGKRVVHFADLLFDVPSPDRTPYIAERRENRLKVKRRLSADLGCADGNPAAEEATNERGAVKLNIPESLLRKMDRLFISENDVYDVVDRAERENRAFVDPVTEERIGHMCIGLITCWVVYKENGGVFDVLNVYAHRIRVVNENNK